MRKKTLYILIVMLIALFLVSCTADNGDSKGRPDNESIETIQKDSETEERQEKRRMIL